MSSISPTVFSKAEIIQASRTADWLILVLSFLVFCGGFHVHAMLTMGDWDFWTDWKDRRLWPTVTPIMCITFPAAVQYWMWDKLRLPLGATFTILGLLFGEWVNRYFNFWGWTYFPINFVWAATLVPGAIILDVILLWSKSFLITAVVGGLSFGLIFYPGNWSMLAVLHQPVEYNGMMMTIADIQGYHYVRTGTPEYIRFVEKGSLRTFGKDVVPVSAFFSGFICIIIYFVWHFMGRWYSTTRFIDSDLVIGTVDVESVQSKGENPMHLVSEDVWYSSHRWVVSIFVLSIVMAVVGISLLGGTTVGAAMFFGGALLAYEYFLLLSKIKRTFEEKSQR